MSKTYGRLNLEVLSSLHVQYEWLAPDNLENTWIIGSQDLDGLLSYAVIKKIAPSVQFAGFYSNGSLLMTSAALERVHADGYRGFRAIDHDIYLMPSVGHGFMLSRSPFSNVNPHLLRGYTSPQQFYERYPLNLVVFLWSWFNLTIPTNSRRSDFLRLLFYSDNVLMKMVQRHTENCRGWLNWLNVDVAVGELIKLATTPTSIQLSRCIYKTFGSTQIKLQLVGRPDNPMVIDAVNNDTVISWTNWFCDMLGLPYIDLPKTYFLADVFSQNRVDPGIEVRYLADHKLHGQQVISDALIGRNLWSVTLATNQKKVAGEVSFQNDLQNESDYWIRQLELTNECIAPLGPCRQICPKT